MITEEKYIFKNHLFNFKDLPINSQIRLLEMDIEKSTKLLEELKTKIITDCTTCKHISVSIFLNPCYKCSDSKKYTNYEEAR